MAEDVVRIEQRLQDPPRLAFLSLDEGLVVAIPLAIGLLTRHLVPGLLAAFLCWQGWKLIKGDGGLEFLVAALYWFLPRRLSPYKALPDSAVTLWRG